jgi:glutaredoxin
MSGPEQNKSSSANSAKTANPANVLAPAPPPSPQVALAPAITPSAAAPTYVPAAVPAPVPQQAGTVSYATIEDPKAARPVMELLAKLASVVDAPPGTPEGQIATIFFDPRCPYCHAAFAALHGRIAARWVPVVVLGDPEGGNRMAAGILSATDRVAALKAAFETKGGKPGEITPEIGAKLAENKEAFASIFAASPALRPGVPTMFVPRPDGRLAIMVGYETGDDAKLRAVLTGS